MTSLPWTPFYIQENTTTNFAEDNIGYWAVALTVFFGVAVFSFENYLNYRQSLSYSVTEFPKELETTVSVIDAGKEDEKKILPSLQEKFPKAQAYGKDKVRFGMIAAGYEIFEGTLFLLLGFMPYLWDVAVEMGKGGYFYWVVEGEIGVSLIFLLLVTIVGTITALPFEVYSTFKIEKKHGFNKTTVSLFITDKIKGFFLSMIIGGPFISLLLKIIKWGGEYFYLYVWVFAFLFSIIMMTIVPVVIMPLFNKYEKLPDGELKDAIVALSERLSYPLKKLFVMDGSKRSSHSNAFMFGFGKNKRIVLFDTLLTQVDQAEVVAILGHELGHWKLKHTVINLAITQLYFGAAFYMFSLCYTNNDLYAAFGFATPVPTIIALLIFFQTMWAPVEKLLSFVMTLFSRKCEFDADRFSADLGMSSALQRGLCKIHLENLGAMCPDWLYSTYHYSHPPLVERLGAMIEYEKKSK